MQEFWANLRNLSAFKQWWGNLTSQPLLTLRNEINPSWWVQFDGWFGPSLFQEVVKGWFGLHLIVALLLTAILGINWWQMVLVAFGLEILQFIKAKAEFINPINSLLDIGSYTLWCYLYTKYIGFHLFKVF